MAVCDKDAAVRRHQNVGGGIEGVGAVAGDTGPAERHQQLAVMAELHDGVTAAIVFGAAVAHPHVVIGVDVKAVGVVEHPGAERRDQLAVLVEMLDRTEIGAGAIVRRRATIEYPHRLAVAIDIDTDRGAPFAALGKLRPSVIEAIELRR